MAARTPWASNTSQTTGSAPTASSCAARSTERVMAVTSCPAFNSCGTSRVPITPVAPATNTRIAEKVHSRAARVEALAALRGRELALEPIAEACLGQARVGAGEQRALARVDAEVARVRVGDHL